MRCWNLRHYSVLLLTIVLYSYVSVFSKLASGAAMLSWSFILFYGMSILLLMVYTVLWQQVLKRFELSIAYAAKPIATILSIIWAVVFFHERITWNMVLGAVIIFFGIWVVNGKHEK